jgi:hypothetical protein
MDAEFPATPGRADRMYRGEGKSTTRICPPFPYPAHDRKMQIVPVCSNAPSNPLWEKAEVWAAFGKGNDEALALAKTEAQPGASSPLLRL